MTKHLLKSTPAATACNQVAPYKTLNCYESRTDAFGAIIPSLEDISLSSRPLVPLQASPSTTCSFTLAVPPLPPTARAFQRHRATENKVFLRFPAVPSCRSLSSRPPCSSSRHASVRSYASSPREVFKNERERGGAPSELSSRAANQTTRQQSRPLKRVVFHTPSPVTD